VYTDGAARGNPGPAGLGVVIEDDQGLRLRGLCRYIGTATNNRAEYLALIEGLRAVQEWKPDRLEVFLDSKLVVEQVGGRWRIKNKDLMPLLRDGHALILRSTIAPGTTEFVAGYIEKRRDLRVGEDVFVAHAPERIAAGRFLAEIVSLPCIIGGVGESSTDRAASLFAVFGGPIVKTTPVQAELAKIWTNILRYAHFALPNLLMMDCDRYGANVFEVIELINRDYPRGGMARPGMTAGTCLRKDFAFSEERSAAPGMLLAVSRVNEAVPLFLVEGIKRRIGSLANRKVAVLGLTFKRNTDDERDSLSPKLIRLLERELADVAVCDSYARTPTQPLTETVADADVVIVATNHSEFEQPAAIDEILTRSADDCLLVDPWNSLGTKQVFAYAGEIAMLRSEHHRAQDLHELR